MKEPTKATYSGLRKWISMFLRLRKQPKAQGGTEEDLHGQSPEKGDRHFVDCYHCPGAPLGMTKL